MIPTRGLPFLLLLAAACAAGPTLLPERPPDPVESRIATAVEKTLFAVPMVDEREASVRAYLEGGFTALAMRDPGLRIAVDEQAIQVAAAGQPPRAVPLPGGWERGAERRRSEIALAAARAVGEARRLSAPLAALPGPALEEIFLRGALGRIDPEGRVFRPRELAAPASARLPGATGLVLRAPGAEVDDVVAGSPADEAGIGRGAVVVSIDGWATQGRGADEVAARLLGELGSHVHLVLRDPGGTRTVDLPRRRVVPLLARPERFPGGILALRPLGLGGGLGRALHAALHEGGERPGVAAAGAIIDLRGNAGGPLAAVGEVASLFVERGRLYAVAGRDSTVAEKPGGDTSFPQMPLVLLVDEATADSAELLAASLQDHRRAAVVGSRTAGRGVVQVTHELGPSPDDLQLQVTAGRLARPSGERIQGHGVQPDLCTSQPAGSAPREPDPSAWLALPRVDCPRRKLQRPAQGRDMELELGLALLRSPSLYGRAVRAAAK